MSILEAYALMEGMAKFIHSGAVPTLKRVQWTDFDQPCTDGDTIYLPKINAEATSEELLLWRYKAEHELGHEDPVNAAPHWKTVAKANPKIDNALKFIWNVLSDHVQERNRTGKYAGRDDVLLRGREVFMRKVIFPTLRNPDKLPDKPSRTINSMFVMDARNRAGWNPHIADTLAALETNVLTDVLSEADRLSVLVDWSSLRTEQDCLDAARKLREAMDLPPPEDAASEDAGTGGEAEVGTDASDADDKEGGAEDEREGKRKPGKGKPDKGDDERKDAERRAEHGEALDKAGEKAIEVMEGHVNAMPGKPSPDSSFSHGKGDMYILREGVPCAYARKADGRYVEALRRLVHRSTLPAQVRRYFMTMKRDKWTTGYRSGRLDTSRLPDVLRGRDDVFRRAEHRITVNSAVSLLVDCSSSMNNSDDGKTSYIQNAMASAFMLAEALAGVGVSVEINGFTEHDNEQFIYHNIKRFDQRWNPTAALNNMSAIMPFLCQNPDGEAILRAYHDLKQRLEPRKVLIVLSDGIPEGYGHDKNTKSIPAFTKHVLDEIQADKDVAVFCIGLGMHDPKRVGYKNYEFARDTRTLGTVLLNLVKRAIR